MCWHRFLCVVSSEPAPGVGFAMGFERVMPAPEGLGEPIVWGKAGR